MLNSLESQISALYASAHELLYLGVDGSPIYSDHFNLCLSLLMGYTATIYNNGDKENRIQSILNRCWEVLDKLPPSLLKARLLTYCYGEVYDDNLAQDAHTIINSWSGRELTKDECEVIDLLKTIEDNPYPWSEV